MRFVLEEMSGIRHWISCENVQEVTLNEMMDVFGPQWNLPGPFAFYSLPEQGFLSPDLPGGGGRIAWGDVILLVSLPQNPEPSGFVR